VVRPKAGVTLITVRLGRVLIGAAKGAFDKKSLREDATAANGRCGGSGKWRAGLFDRWQ